MSTVTPDPTPDLATAAHREIRKLTSTLLAAGLQDATDDWPEPWIFKGDARRQVQGSGKASIVVSSPSPWAGATRGHTTRFPRLQIEVYSDRERTTDGAPALRDAEAQAEDIWLIVDRVLHRVDGGGFLWGSADGTLRITSSTRADGDRSISPVPDTDGVVRLLCVYDVEL